IVVASLGIWGCARGPANGSVSLERIRALEEKIAKLEDDFRASIAVRDQLRKKLATADEERNQLHKERDELRQQLGTVQDQFVKSSKEIKNLLGQLEQPSSPAQPVTSVADSPGSGKS